MSVASITKRKNHMSKPELGLTPFDVAKKTLTDDAFRKQVALALPKHMTPDRMLRVALTAALNNPKIAEVCTTAIGKASICKAMLQASQLGLEVDGRQGHLVPFNDKRAGGLIVQFIPGYQGLIGLAYNHPKVKAIWADVVYANDHFVHKKGLDRVLEHVPADSDDRGELTHAYAVCEMEGGAKTFVCLTKREVLKARKSSRGADSDYSPWNTHPESMWAKTAIRNLAKFIPQSSELRDAIEIDDAASTIIDVQSTPVVEEAKPALAPEKPVEKPADKPVETNAKVIGEYNEKLYNKVVVEMFVSEEDFLGWAKTTGRIKSPEDKATAIAELSKETCEKILADENLFKCGNLYGKK